MSGRNRLDELEDLCIREWNSAEDPSKLLRSCLYNAFRHGVEQRTKTATWTVFKDSDVQPAPAGEGHGCSLIDCGRPRDHEIHAPTYQGGDHPYRHLPSHCRQCDRREGERRKGRERKVRFNDVFRWFLPEWSELANCPIDRRSGSDRRKP